ncbi:hypothetical protein PBV87_11615 [Niameybacter massiliensis]|uniref:Uncharacterized protein n=1 Tax=Holtiella tumoricola TaxID=3018743 RepID=A0AA42DNT4_9FIRM|nr:hypothetical protein [Holtiella tumoricola]MDA3732131.1 hypothetical protein [Holtiella tumoricola]
MINVETEVKEWMKTVRELSGNYEASDEEVMLAVKEMLLDMYEDGGIYPKNYLEICIYINNQIYDMEEFLA